MKNTLLITALAVITLGFACASYAHYHDSYEEGHRGGAGFVGGLVGGAVGAATGAVTGVVEGTVEGARAGFHAGRGDYDEPYTEEEETSTDEGTQEPYDQE